MVFSSLLFAYFFLPLTVIVYYISKDRYKNTLLVIASLLFYAYGEPGYVLLMIVSIIMNYSLGVLIGRAGSDEKKTAARNYLVVAILLNTGILYFFKYLNYTLLIFTRISGIDPQIPDIRLPIGISFFTFQAMSYCIDVYRGSVKAQKNPLYVALYISFFPQLIAGPIVRYRTIEEQIMNRMADKDDLAKGIRRFLIGFSKKIILANNIAIIAEGVFKLAPDSCNPVLLWIGSFAYSMQIYFDFSGYSDMAIGLGRMFGFHFEENFNYPYISRTVTEFWRRWHISLSTWFRDYVYIPLGGSRVSVWRNILNLFIVWLLTGIWHGANITFVVWGLMFFVLLVIEKWILKPEKRKKLFFVIWCPVTLLLVNFEWVIFNSDSLRKAAGFIKGMLGMNGNRWEIDPTVIRIMTEYGFFFAAGIICCTPLISGAAKRLTGVLSAKASAAVRITEVVTLCFLFIWSTSFLIMGYHNPFIYFNF